MDLDPDPDPCLRITSETGVHMDRDVQLHSQLSNLWTHSIISLALYRYKTILN